MGSVAQRGEKTQLGIVFGALATALYQIEKDWQRTLAKHPDELLLALISHLRELRSLDQYLEAVVEGAHEFIEPTRTNVYWFERERRYFWRRVSNRQVAPSLGWAITGFWDHCARLGRILSGFGKGTNGLDWRISQFSEN